MPVETPFPPGIRLFIVLRGKPNRLWSCGRGPIAGSIWLPTVYDCYEVFIPPSVPEVRIALPASIAA